MAREKSYEERLAEVRRRFGRVGVTIPKVARDIGVHPEIIRRLLKGQTKGTRGASHKAAVLLGLKDGVVVEAGSAYEAYLKGGEQ
ncbi:hypothetical protein [Tepidimonas taiwanensis]|uniref:hypothetical protein n=1 Tax=Tepidimonas taiwanensis TaxID=307486 RepID=UPI00068C0F8F|nr:hypothetical protein [Tepidimonas taiwanensis]